MGENGAGKSTLMKILAGAYAADPDGEIRIDGTAVTIGTPAAAMGHGIAVIYQELSLSPNLTVAENIYLGREIRRGIFADRKAMQLRCRGILKSLGATFSPADLVSNLSLAEQQLVEIARAIHANVRILVMDEPTAALSAHESERLFALIEQTARTRARNRLRQPPDGGDRPAGRSRHGPPGRGICRHDLPRRADAGTRGADDGRSRPRRFLQAGSDAPIRRSGSRPSSR